MHRKMPFINTSIYCLVNMRWKCIGKCWMCVFTFYTHENKLFNLSLIESMVEMHWKLPFIGTKINTPICHLVNQRWKCIGKCWIRVLTFHTQESKHFNLPLTESAVEMHWKMPFIQTKIYTPICHLVNQRWKRIGKCCIRVLTLHTHENKHFNLSPSES
jgi:hypothetical protein